MRKFIYIKERKVKRSLIKKTSCSVEPINGYRWGNTTETKCIQIHVYECYPSDWCYTAGLGNIPRAELRGSSICGT